MNDHRVSLDKPCWNCVLLGALAGGIAVLAIVLILVDKGIIGG